jgi:CRISPR-associated protein Cmr2
MQPYLFLISVGPVQEFIAAARRSRDLWFGSQLLSELSRAAALAVTGDPFRGALIFPAPAGPAGPAPRLGRNVANRILAELDGRAPAAELGAAVEAAVRARLGELRAAALGAASISWDARRPELRALAERQVDDLPELFWAAAPLSGGYPQARDQLEALMAATKAARAFGPSPAAAHPELRQPKSSLDGARESVIPEDRLPGGRDAPEVRRRKAERLYQDYRGGRAERLSGVDLLKRRGLAADSGADFPSTSHFAALPFLAREAARGADMGAALDRYVAGLRRAGGTAERLDERFKSASPLGAYDAAILFEERLAEEVDKADLPEARGHLAEFFASATAGRRPEPYYALLLADGDSMGKAIDAQATPQDHRALSQALDDFADNVRAVVERDHLGALVYSGGDDVLAFLPLHTALACAKSLADDFRGRLAGFADADGRAPTLSVGVAVSHHIEPLADALRLARQAERAAKAVEGKDALAVTVSKRSGADRTVRGRWAGPLFERLRTFVGWHVAGTVPDGAAYELLDLHTRLAGPGGDEPAGALATAMAEDAVRIFKRKRGLRGEAAVSREAVAYVRAQLGLAPERDGDPAPLDAANRLTVRQLADELIVAREFARAAGQASAEKGAS